MAATKDYGFDPNKNLRNLEDFMKDYLSAKFETMWPIGSIVILMDSANKNPLDLGYPGKRWELIGGGQMLVCRANSGDWNHECGYPVGSAGTNHTHLIVGEEDLPSGCPALSGDERQIYADMLPANSPNVDQAASKQASGGGDPMVRFLLHSDTSHWEYSDDSSTYVDPQYGKLELRPVWPNTVLNGGASYPLSENKIRATASGSGGDIGTNYPPGMLCNIWKRTL